MGQGNPYDQHPTEERGEYATPIPVAAPAPRKRRRVGLWIAVGLAAFFCVTAIVLFIVMKVSSLGRGWLTVGGYARPDFTEQTVTGTGDEKILLIPLKGIITDAPQESLFRAEPGMVTTIRAMLARASESGDIKAVILEIESPGGGVTASDILCHEFLTFHEETGIPIVCLMDDVAASGAYYVAASAQHIVAHPTTVTGSIGVVMPLFNAEELMNKIGIEARPIKSGKRKDMGSFWRDVNEEERKMLQQLVDELHERFVSIVVQGFKGRGQSKQRGQIETYCDGRIFSGPEAKKLGFVDEIGYFDDALNAACRKANLGRSQARVVTYVRKASSLLDRLVLQAPPGSKPGITINIQGLGDLKSTRFLYLWTVGNANALGSGVRQVNGAR